MLQVISDWSRHVDASLKSSPDAVETITNKMQKTVYVASGATTFLGLTQDEWGIAAIVIGIVISVFTGAFNIWFKMRYQRRPDDEVSG